MATASGRATPGPVPPPDGAGEEAAAATHATKVLARNLRRLRAEQGVTLAELGLASGVPRATLVLLEAGSGQPPGVEALWHLALALGVTPAALVGHPAGGSP